MMQRLQHDDLSALKINPLREAVLCKFQCSGHRKRVRGTRGVWMAATGGCKQCDQKWLKNGF